MRTIWVKTDGTVLDWHHELIENHVMPATNTWEGTGAHLRGVTPDAVMVDDSIDGEWALYGKWGEVTMYLCSPEMTSLSEDLRQSIEQDDQQS